MISGIDRVEYTSDNEMCFKRHATERSHRERSQKGSRASTEQSAIDAPLWRRRVAALLAVVASSLPCHAFEVDGLRSGMTLEEFRKAPTSKGRRLDLLDGFSGKTVIVIDGRERADFCHDTLVFLTRRILDYKTLSSLIRLATAQTFSERKSNEVVHMVHGDVFYETDLSWMVDGDAYSLHFWADRPVTLEEIGAEETAEAVISFKDHQPSEVLEAGKIDPQCTYQP